MPVRDCVTMNVCHVPGFQKRGGIEEEVGAFVLINRYGLTGKGVHREHSYISITSNMTSMTVTYTQHRTPTIPCSLSLAV